MAPLRIRQKCKKDHSQSSLVVVLVTMRVIGKQCSFGFTFFLACVGVTLCLAYFLLVTLPHSLWVQEAVFDGKEVFPAPLRQPGLSILGSITGKEVGYLQTLDRTNVSERAMSELLRLCEKMGFSYANLESHALSYWSYYEFGVDLLFMVGFAASLMLLVAATSKRVKSSTTQCLTYPYILFVFTLVILSLTLEIFLAVQFHSKPRQEASTVEGEHVFMKVLLAIGLFVLLFILALVSTVTFANNFNVKVKMARRKRSLPESGNNSASETEAKKMKSEELPPERRDLDAILGD